MSRHSQRFYVQAIVLFFLGGPFTSSARPSRERNFGRRHPEEQGSPKFTESEPYVPLSVLADHTDDTVRINAVAKVDTAASITHCIFTADIMGGGASIVPASVEVFPYPDQTPVSKGFVNLRWSDVHITCSSRGIGSMMYGTVQMGEGSTWPRLLPVEYIETEPKGEVCLCGPSYYSERAWVKDWAQHHVNLGVTEVHLYIPEGKWFELFATRPEIFTRFDKENTGVYSKHAGQLSVTRPKAEEHPNIRWHSYEAPPGLAGFAIHAVLNDCLARVKRSFKYAVVIDVDEFITLRQRTNVDTIGAFMNKYLPESVAALSLVQINFPIECSPVPMALDDAGQPAFWPGLFGDAFTLHFDFRKEVNEAMKDVYWGLQTPTERDLFPQSFKKSIVRVSDIKLQNAHNPDSLVNATKTRMLSVPEHLGYAKHIRSKGPHTCVFGSKARQDWMYNGDYVLHIQQP